MAIFGKNIHIWEKIEIETWYLI